MFWRVWVVQPARFALLGHGRHVGSQRLSAKQHPEPGSRRTWPGPWLSRPTHQPDTKHVDMYRIQLSNPGMNAGL